MSLTPEQVRLIEQKRRQAMAIREAKRTKAEPLASVTNVSPFATKSVLGSAASKPTASHLTASPYFSGQAVKRPAASSSTGNETVSKSKVNGQAKAGPSNAAKKKIQICLFSSSRLSVSFAYDPILISEVKKMPTSMFDQETKTWTVALEDYIKLIEGLKRLEGSVVLDANSVPARVISFMLSERISKPVDLSERLPQQFIDNMFPFQREGVKFAIRRSGRCMIADDMGLGKTVQALAVAHWFREDWPLIIVCPASVTRTWKQAILKWIDFVSPDDIEIAESPSYFPKCKIVIMSYDRLSRSTEDVMRRNANFIIFDECHSIKSAESQRSRSALTVAKAAKRVILLSGTPALSRPMELYTQLFALNRKLFPSKHDFGLRYCNAQPRFFGPKQIWDYKGNSNTDELRILLESTLMIRRLKKDVLQDLPRKNRTTVQLAVDLSEEEERENRNFHNMLSGEVSNTGAGDKRKELMEWYNSTASVKIPAVVSYLTGKLQRVKKLICFAYHKVMVEALCEFLASKCISYIVITGETPPKIRQDCCNVFQESLKVRVAVVSIVAAGVGITLTAAHEVVFAELFWNPGILIQAEDRAHRIGQEEKVTIEYLLAKGTVDDVIWKMVAKKLTVLNKVGLSDDSMGSAASRDQNQPVIEAYFAKTKIKEEPTNQEEEDLISLLEDVPTEETGVKFNGLVSFEAAGSSKEAQVVSQDGDDDEEEFLFDDDDLFCVPESKEIQID